jgi:hypothetical protein
VVVSCSMDTCGSRRVTVAECCERRWLRAVVGSVPAARGSGIFGGDTFPPRGSGGGSSQVPLNSSFVEREHVSLTTTKRRAPEATEQLFHVPPSRPWRLDTRSPRSLRRGCGGKKPSPPGDTTSRDHVVGPGVHSGSRPAIAQPRRQARRDALRAAKCPPDTPGKGPRAPERP